MNDLRTVTAPIFNIQSYCIHDGPGIRSTVFVKGCPLQCVWCHNPESNSSKPELMEYGSKCTGCGKCLAVCPGNAISLSYNTAFSKYVAVSDRSVCSNCGKCAEVCPSKARELAGTIISAGEVFDEIAADKIFYDSSGGGITLSGGEIMMYPRFASALFQLCHENGIHTAIESCMFATRETIEMVVKHTDLVICDIKHMDSSAHKRLTGVHNDLILNNILYVHNVLRKPVIIRTPVVMGMNADEENIAATAKFIADHLGSDTLYQLLPYHNLGDSKLESLGRPTKIKINIPEAEYMQHLKQVAEKNLINVQIGGD